MALQACVELLLAAVFLVAGSAKLHDLPGSKEALANFGVPRPLIAPAAFLLPALEILLALGLLWPASFHPAALGTALLSLVFLAAITYQLAKGRKPDCHCFGQLYSKPLSGSTVARNALILAAAAWLATRAALPTNPFTILWASLATLTPRSLNLLVLAIVCTVSLVQTVFLLEVMKQNGRLLLKLENLPELPRLSSTKPAPKQQQPSLPIGAAAPEFTLPSIAGTPVSLREMRSTGKPTLLVFSDPECGPCKALLPELTGWQSSRSSQFDIAVISRGTVAENKAKAPHLHLLLLQQDREVAEAFGCQGTPAAVLISARGLLETEMAYGAPAIRELVNQQKPAPQVALQPVSPN